MSKRKKRHSEVAPVDSLGSLPVCVSTRGTCDTNPLRYSLLWQAAPVGRRAGQPLPHRLLSLHYPHTQRGAWPPPSIDAING